MVLIFPSSARNPTKNDPIQIKIYSIIKVSSLEFIVVSLKIYRYKLYIIPNAIPKAPTKKINTNISLKNLFIFL